MAATEDTRLAWLPLKNILEMRRVETDNGVMYEPVSKHPKMGDVRPGSTLEDYAPYWNLAKELGCDVVDFEALQRDGYVVSKAVITPEEADDLKHRLAADVRSVKPGSAFDIDDPSTHTADNVPPNLHGINDYPGCGWLPTLLHVRTRCPDVIFRYLSLFAFLLQGRVSVRADFTSPHEVPEAGDRPDDMLITRGNLRGYAGDLVCSIDRYNLSLSIRGAEKSWEHVDQGPAKRGVWAWQSFVALTPQSGDRGTLQVRRRSHERHDRFMSMKAKSKFKGDFVKVADDPAALDLYDGCPKVLIDADAGDLVVWDSRTVHQGHRPMVDGGVRMAVYVCYAPRTWLSPTDYAKKQQAMRELRATSHWPYEVTLFPKMPRHYGHPEKYTELVVAAPDLDALQRRILGVE